MATNRAPLKDEIEQRAPQRPESAYPGLPPGFVLHEDTGDKFHIPSEDIPDGQDYQWAALTVMGKVDSQAMANFARNRWTPVPLSRHPHYGTDGGLIDGQKGTRIGKESIVYEECIIREGMLLMERPMAITQFVRQHEKKKADDQVINQMQRVKMAPEGTLSGVNKQRNVSITRGRDLSIPEDAE